jgi:hypothetical protein
VVCVIMAVDDVFDRLIEPLFDLVAEPGRRSASIGSVAITPSGVTRNTEKWKSFWNR